MNERESSTHASSASVECEFIQRKFDLYIFLHLHRSVIDLFISSFRLDTMGNMNKIDGE
jgi:hypothetical protein